MTANELIKILEELTDEAGELSIMLCTDPGVFHCLRKVVYADGRWISFHTKDS